MLELDMVYPLHVQLAGGKSKGMFTNPIVIPPPLIGVGIKRCFCLASDICLLRTLGLTQEQRGLGRPKLA